MLLVDPSYKENWDLPGGMAEANESPRAAAQREVREELGVSITASRLLVVDWVGPHGSWDDQLVFIFDGGVLNADQVDTMSITDDELTAFAFVAPIEAAQRLRVDVGQRLNRALTVLTKNATDYHELR